MLNLLYFLLGGAVVVAAILVRQRFWSFQAQAPEDYADRGPDFDLRRHLDGPLICEGLLYGPSGRVTSRFVAEMEGRWEGDTGTLDERFTYDNGQVQTRRWVLRIEDDGAVTGRADDVVGQAEGRQKGPGLQLTYRLKLPEASGGHVLEATDWMYLLDNGAIINRSQFRKFGLPVAELVATLRPREAMREAAE